MFLPYLGNIFVLCGVAQYYNITVQMREIYGDKNEK